MKVANDKHAAFWYFESARQQLNLNTISSGAVAALRGGQTHHDGLEDSASDPSTGSLALLARGCFRWSRARGDAVFWEGFRYSRRTLPYCRCSHGLVWRDGPGSRCLTPFASEPRLFLPAAGSLRRDRGDSCALSRPLPRSEEHTSELQSPM